MLSLGRASPLWAVSELKGGARRSPNLASDSSVTIAFRVPRGFGP